MYILSAYLSNLSPGIGNGNEKQLFPFSFFFMQLTTSLSEIAEANLYGRHLKKFTWTEEKEIIQGVPTCYNRLWQIQLDPGPGGGDLLRYQTMDGRDSPSSVQCTRNYENIYQRIYEFIRVCFDIVMMTSILIQGWGSGSGRIRWFLAHRIRYFFRWFWILPVTMDL